MLYYFIYFGCLCFFNQFPWSIYKYKWLSYWIWTIRCGVVWSAWEEGKRGRPPRERLSFGMERSSIWAHLAWLRAARLPWQRHGACRVHPSNKYTTNTHLPLLPICPAEPITRNLFILKAQFSIFVFLNFYPYWSIDVHNVFISITLIFQNKYLLLKYSQIK